MGNFWEIFCYEEKVEIKLGGDIEIYIDKEGNYCVRWIFECIVIGMFYDILVLGYNINIVNNLWLWSVKVSNEFDL